MVNERTGRTEKTTQERRRRKPNQTGGKRLAVNPELLDFERFAYRWLNDSDVRLIEKTKYDDWDFVDSSGGKVKEDSTDMGSAVSIAVGVKPDGSPLRAFLVRKPKNWYEDDVKTKQEELDEQLERLRQGQSASGGAKSDYIPSEGIKVA